MVISYDTFYRKNKNLYSIQFQSKFQFKECFSFFPTEKIEEIIIPKRIKRFVSFLIEEVILYLNGLYKYLFQWVWNQCYWLKIKEHYIEISMLY